MSGKNDVRFERLDKNQPGQYDGIMAFGVFSEEEMEFLRMQSFAIVFINSDPKDYEYDSIVMDFNKGIHEMLDYLMDQKKYCSVGYIGGIYEEGQVRIGYRRLEGIRGAFMQRGFYEEENFYIGDISRESGYHLAKQAIQSGRLPEAVLLGSEEVAEGALEAFQDADFACQRMWQWSSIRTLRPWNPNGPRTQRSGCFLISCGRQRSSFCWNRSRKAVRTI